MQLTHGDQDCAANREYLIVTAENDAMHGCIAYCSKGWRCLMHEDKSGGQRRDEGGKKMVQKRSSCDPLKQLSL